MTAGNTLSGLSLRFTLSKHAKPYDEEHDFNLTIVRERKRVAKMAVEKDRQRMLDRLKTLRCEFDGVEHNCSAWKDSKHPPSAGEIVEIIEDFDYNEYYKQLLIEMGYDIQT